MPEEFQDYKEQYDDIINYSGLTYEEIKEICTEVKKYFETITVEYSMQNVVDTIQITTEMILSNKTSFEAKTISQDEPVLLSVSEAIALAVEKVLPNYELEAEDIFKI